MKMYCLKCGSPLSDTHGASGKGKVKCSVCKSKFRYKATEDGMIITARRKNVPFNRTLEIITSDGEG